MAVIDVVVPQWLVRHSRRHLRRQLDAVDRRRRPVVWLRSTTSTVSRPHHDDFTSLHRNLVGPAS